MYYDRWQCIKIWSRKPTQGIKICNACIKICSRLNVLRSVTHVLRYGAESRKPSQCIKIGNVCIKIWSRVNVLRYVMHVLRYGKGCFCHNFRHCETFSKKFFGWPPPARIIISSADNYYACGYFITRADIDVT